MSRVKAAADRALRFAAILLFVLLVLTVFWQVFTRQVLNDPSTWSEALARYLFVWLSFFGAALVFAERGHIAVDFAVRKAPMLAQRVIAVFVQLVITGFTLVILVWGGWRAAQGAWDQNVSGLPTQAGPLFLVMPITGAIIAGYSCYHLVAILRGTEDPVPAPDDVV